MEEYDADVLDGLGVGLPRRRSNFLTVICILTWVGCGLIVLFYLYAVKFRKINAGLEGSSHGQANWYKWGAFSKLLAPLLCAAGGVLMWNLRRTGFYLYVTGQLIPIGLSIWLALGAGSGREADLFGILLQSSVPIAFVVMYALNLKDMRGGRQKL